MTSRERIKAVFGHVQPDRTPIFEYILLSPVADVILGRAYAGEPDYWCGLLKEKGWEDAVKQIALDRLELACILGHDMMWVPPNPLPTDTVGFSFPSSEDLADDPVGVQTRRNERYAEKPRGPRDDTLLVYRILKNQMQQRGIDLPILADAVEHGIWTDVNLMATMVLAPEVAHRHFELATERSLASIERYTSLGLDAIIIGGDFAGNTLLISPEAYEEFIVPQLRILSRRIHEAGTYAINASDGNLWPVIDDFLLSSKVDGYLEIDQYAGMDLRKLKHRYGDKITFLGNLDCGNLLSFGTSDQIRRHVIECLEAGMGNGGHIFCASNAIVKSIPLSNYLTVINTYREVFSLPKIAF